MKTVVRDLIEYSGIVQCFDMDIESFKQINVEAEVCVPIQKPDIEQLSKVTAETVIKSSRVIRTPKGVSLEGFKLTGYKLIVEGEINYKVQYVADEITQSVHLAHFSVPFVNHVVLPENFMPTSIITASAFIEDIFAQELNERCIFLNATILLVAETC